MPRSGHDGVPGRRESDRSTSCSRGTDWAVEEHVEVRRAYKQFSSQKRTECLLHKKVDSSKRRQTWSQEEDDILIKMVNMHSSKNWSTIACSIPGRNPNQCRERWMFYLDPAVNKQPWSEQEEITLIHAHQIHGNKWCELARKHFPGRTGKAIKNHWASLKNKKLKSDFVRGLPEQIPHIPTDSLIAKNKCPSTNKSGQDSSIPVSPEMPVRPKLEQGLTEAGTNPSTLNGKAFDSIHGEGSVPCLVNVSQKEDGQIACNIRSSDDHSDEICCSADSESQVPHLANLADLLDMSYCESLMIIPPDSPNDGNSMHGM